MATAEQALVMMRLKRGQRQEENGKTIQFEEVYRQYFRPLYSFVAYRVADRPAAEDITSQVFEKALRAYPNYDHKRAAVSTWLFTIARNAVTDHYRTRKQQADAGLNENLAISDEGDPEHELEALEMSRELARALAGLGAQEHEVLALKFGAGITNREIGKLLEISESNAGTIIYRSLKKLKNQLEGGIEND